MLIFVKISSASCLDFPIQPFSIAYDENDNQTISNSFVKNKNRGLMYL